MITQVLKNCRALVRFICLTYLRILCVRVCVCVYVCVCAGVCVCVFIQIMK
jgi:hypothetical protein